MRYSFSLDSMKNIRHNCQYIHEGFTGLKAVLRNAWHSHLTYLIILWYIACHKCICHLCVPGILPTVMDRYRLYLITIYDICKSQLLKINRNEHNHPFPLLSFFLSLRIWVVVSSYSVSCFILISGKLCFVSITTPRLWFVPMIWYTVSCKSHSSVLYLVYHYNCTDIYESTTHLKCLSRIFCRVCVLGCIYFFYCICESLGLCILSLHSSVLICVSFALYSNAF